MKRSTLLPTSHKSRTLLRWIFIQFLAASNNVQYFSHNRQIYDDIFILYKKIQLKKLQALLDNHKPESGNSLTFVCIHHGCKLHVQLRCMHTQRSAHIIMVYANTIKHAYIMQQWWYTILTIIRESFKICVWSM